MNDKTIQLSVEDWECLSRSFNQTAHIAIGTRDYRINEWLKQRIIEAKSGIAAHLESGGAPMRSDEVGHDVEQIFDDRNRCIGFECLTCGAKAAFKNTLQHLPEPDDIAVDAFALAMKDKLRIARNKGRNGWNDKEDCNQQHLSDLLHRHIEKGDPVDVANFCMFLQQRGEEILPQDALKSAGRRELAGWQLVPKELTAENGCKCALVGELKLENYIDGDAEDGEMRTTTISWTDVKRLWREILAKLPAAPPAPTTGWLPKLTAEELNSVIGVAINKLGNMAALNLNGDWTQRDGKQRFIEITEYLKAAYSIPAAPVSGKVGG